MVTRRGLSAFLLLSLTLGAGRGAAAATRDDEPVLVTGAAFPELAGQAIDEIVLFAWDAAAARYAPIPAQVDERLLAAFNPGTPYAFSQLMYDVARQEDGTLDADDEVAFMYRDAGSAPAPADAPWPAGAGPVSYEILVDDPLGAAGSAPRFVYLFTGAGLPRSPVRYVSWNGAEDAPVASDRFEVGFAGRWLVNEFRVRPPCGSGGDLIDRVKGRARPLPTREEDEEGWNTNSTWLGGLLGPVRAIRYVRGATSGFNTILHDVVYPTRWSRTIHLRVHPLISTRLYVDWLPGAGRTAFFSTARDGVTVDGNPDPAVGPSLASWSLTRTPEGGAAVLFDVPANPAVEQRSTYYRDDRLLNDQIATNPGYGDDDDASYGAAGIELRGIGDSQVDGIDTELRFHPLCANDGSAVLADTLAGFAQHPLQVESTPRFAALGPIRTLRVAHETGDAVLTWAAAPAVDAYRVYASAAPSLPPPDWTPIGSVVAPAFVDVDPLPPGGLRCYSVVSVAGGQEGAW